MRCPFRCLAFLGMEKGAISSAPLNLSSTGALPRIHRGTQDVKLVAVLKRLDSDRILPGHKSCRGWILPGPNLAGFREPPRQDLAGGPVFSLRILLAPDPLILNLNVSLTILH
jgi:hypothetical protein